MLRRAWVLHLLRPLWRQPCSTACERAVAALAAPLPSATPAADPAVQHAAAAHPAAAATLLESDVLPQVRHVGCCHANVCVTNGDAATHQLHSVLQCVTVLRCRSTLISLRRTS